MDKQLQNDLRKQEVITAKTFLQRKELIKRVEPKNILIEIEGMGAIEFRTPTRQDIKDSQAYADGNKDEFLIFNQCVSIDMTDPDLLEQLGCAPLEVPGKIFKAGEISLIAVTLMSESGFDDNLVRIIDDVKN